MNFRPTIQYVWGFTVISVLLGPFSSRAAQRAGPALPVRRIRITTDHSPQTASDLFRQGVAALQQNRFDSAVQALCSALQLEPGLVLARYDLGVAYFSLGRFEESRQAFQKVLQRNPGHPFARYFLGRIDLVEGDFDRAIDNFESLPSTKPVADELYYLGAAYFRKRDTRRAIRVLERAAARQTGDYRVQLLLARVYESVGRKSEAEKEYCMSERSRASYREKSRQMTECEGLLRRIELEDAVTRCQQLLDGDDPLKLTSLGTLLAERRLYDRAVIPLEKASRLDPENYEAQFNLGLAYFQAKKYREARRPLETAMALRPESYDATALLATVLFVAGDDFPAARELRRAHQLNPRDEKIATLLFEELRMIAQHFFAQGKYKESIPFFKEALSLRPEMSHLRVQLARASAAAADNGVEKENPSRKGR